LYSSLCRYLHDEDGLVGDIDVKGTLMRNTYLKILASCVRPVAATKMFTVHKVQFLGVITIA
jgi:hypothetical protein